MRQAGIRKIQWFKLSFQPSCNQSFGHKLTGFDGIQVEIIQQTHIQIEAVLGKAGDLGYQRIEQGFQVIVSLRL